MPRALFHILADAVLLIHVAFVAFVVVGLLLIVWGGISGWRWIRNPWFRVTHLACIGIVVVQTWFGWECPLTTLEMRWRERAGDAAYGGTFIAHWLQAILYYEAPPWAFTLGYSVFGVLVAGSWWLFRPRSFRKKS